MPPLYLPTIVPCLILRSDNRAARRRLRHIDEDSFKVKVMQKPKRKKPFGKHNKDRRHK